MNNTIVEDINRIISDIKSGRDAYEFSNVVEMMLYNVQDAYESLDDDEQYGRKGDILRVAADNLDDAVGIMSDYECDTEALAEVLAAAAELLSLV